MNSFQEIVQAAGFLLLDFDGPITALMPPPRNAEAADRARAALGGVELPADMQTTSDHLAVLRWTAEHSPDRLAAVEQACSDVEVDCARHSEPNPEILGLLRGTQARGIKVAVVSNNSKEAVRTFLDRYPWGDSIEVLACRTMARTHLMKPDPFLVNTAIRLLAATPSRCIFIGDSVSDVQAGRAAGARTVGLAKDPDRATALESAGADLVVLRLDAL